MNKRIIAISAFCLIAIVGLVRIGLAQEPIFLPIIIDGASTTAESTVTATTVAATSTPAAMLTPVATATDTNSTATGVDTTLFFDGALAEEATVVDCTLSDGTETTCYEITIAGYPANHDVGPFCPETTSTTADDAGIWFDGNGLYDLTGSFVLGLADLYNDTVWKLYNDDGSVNITETAEEFDLAARPNVDPSLQNHCVEGRIEWLENGEPVQTTVTIPVNPVLAESATTGGSWGVTLNGVTIDASAPVDAILSAYTIAAFDDCGGHINPVAGYHLHGARGCSEVGEAAEGETPIFGYAMDGYPIHSALSDEDVVAANLDGCNGHETDELGYHYHANPAEENGVLTCFMGVTVDGGNTGGGPPGGGPPGGGPPGGRPSEDATATATSVATTETTPAATNTPVPTSSAEPTPVGSNYLGSYEIADTGFGTEVNVVVDSDAKTRTIVSNALPNHAVGTFPNPGNPNTISAQDKSWTYPTEPNFLGTATFAREPGVAINGLKFEPATAERATCDGGEIHSIEAIQDVVDLGLDFNNAHVQPTGEYHYHGVSNLLVDLYDSDEDLVHVAFAADGHLIYYSKSGAYQSSYRLGQGDREGTNCSYTNGGSGATTDFGSVKDGSLDTDWDYDASYGQLDECNGITVDGEYIYLITNDYPYIPRCLMGEFDGGGGGPGGGGPPGGGPPNR